ncbi:MAG: polyprenyl synthetase family protein, partial [Gammaproteobacteria bacterium]|nr:polyprenyl synthetase family protein [Gammaproteobacteria bacterium]
MTGIIVTNMHLVQPNSSAFDLDAVRNQLGDDWPAVNMAIFKQLKSDVALVNSVAHYIISSGGKRLRPLLVLLAARACGYKGDHHITAA